MSGRLVVVAGLVLAISMPLWSQNERKSVTSGEGEGVCSRNMNFDDLTTFTAQDEFSVPMTSNTLEVTAAKNGGVRLMRGEGKSYHVTVCKYAGAASQSEGNRLLSEIAADHDSSRLGVHGPSSGNWSAFLVVRVPQNAAMKVSVRNGPLSARNISGSFELVSVNGPIAIRDLEGKANVSAENGPVSLAGTGGEMNLKTTNGPISIELESQKWENGQLDAHAQNGPISLAIPKGFQSGVVLTSSGRAPMSCHVDGCDQEHRTWDEGGEHRIEIGSSPVVHVSTVNGPMDVHTRKSEM